MPDARIALYGRQILEVRTGAPGSLEEGARVTAHRARQCAVRPARAGAPGPCLSGTARHAVRPLDDGQRPFGERRLPVPLRWCDEHPEKNSAIAHWPAGLYALARGGGANRLTGYENALLGYKPSNWKLLQPILERWPRAADVLQVRSALAVEYTVSDTRQRLSSVRALARAVRGVAVASLRTSSTRWRRVGPQTRRCLRRCRPRARRRWWRCVGLPGLAGCVHTRSSCSQTSSDRRACSFARYSTGADRAVPAVCVGRRRRRGAAAHRCGADLAAVLCRRRQQL